MAVFLLVEQDVRLIPNPDKSSRTRMLWVLLIFNVAVSLNNRNLDNLFLRFAKLMIYRFFCQNPGIQVEISLGKYLFFF